MTVHMTQQQAHVGGQTDLRTQYAALCWRVQGDRPQVLLITSRGTGRWIVPKGWPIAGMTPAQSAAREAWEEAGAIGRATEVGIGLYTYDKVMGPDDMIPCLCTVYPLRVRDLADSYPEKGQRRRKWFSPRRAATKVAEPDLAALIRDFDPRALRR